jgi:N-acetylneuraminic acid mutarotase
VDVQTGKHRIEQMLGQMLEQRQEAARKLLVVYIECAAQDLFAWSQPVAEKADRQTQTWTAGAAEKLAGNCQEAAKQLGEPVMQKSGLICQILPTTTWAARAVQDYRYF